MRLSRNVVAFVLTILFVVVSFATRSAYAAAVQAEPIKENQKLQESNIAAQRGELNIWNTTAQSGSALMAVSKCMLLSCPVGPDGLPVASAYGSITAYIGNIYETKPASTQAFVADALRQMNINVAQPAYAQGLGFGSLEPILVIWKAFRNLAYLGFVLIFIVIGFMIMFRQKIGSQSVVTVQQALPNIVVALIAVTFSYAIASLLIDAMYVVMATMVALFSTQVALDSEAFPYLSGNIFDIGKYMFSIGAAGINTVVSSFVKSAMGNENLFAVPVAGFASITVEVIFGFVIVFQVFKLLLALIKTYVEIILQIAFSPVILMLGALPGSKAFSEWIRNLVGNLAVFPAILLLLIVYSVIKQNTAVLGMNTPSLIPQAHAAGFLPPYIASGGTTASQFLPFLVGLGLLMGMSEVPEAVKKAMGVKGGGVLQNIVEGGWKNFRQQSGAPLVAAAAVPGAVVGAGLGAAYGGFIQRGDGSLAARGGRAARGAVYGALGLGAGSSILATGAPYKFARNAAGSAWRQAGDLAVQHTLGERVAGIQSKQSQKKSREETELAARQDEALRQQQRIKEEQARNNIIPTPADDTDTDSGII